MAKSEKDFQKYLCKATKSHTKLDEYLTSPATAFLKYTIEAKSSIDLCIRKFPKNQDGKYSSDSLDSLQHLTVAILPSIMGHFETYQRILFAKMFDYSVFLKSFKADNFLKKLSKDNSINIDLNRIAAYRNIGASSIGRIIADSLKGWHSPEKVNQLFQAFGLHVQLFSSSDIKKLKVLWQLRHSIVHTGGTITLPDAQKVNELKDFGGKTIAFEKNFISEVARKMHPIIENATLRISNKYIEGLVLNINQNDKEKIEQLFLVKSSANTWLK